MNWIEGAFLLKIVLPAALFVPLSGAAAAEGTEVIREKVAVTRIEPAAFERMFDHPAWAEAPRYELLHQARDPHSIRRLPREGGRVQYLYDDRCFYIRAEFSDSDLVNTARQSGGHLYQDGDLVEIFLKPLDRPYYWEIYGTPNRLHTVFYYAEKGRKPCSVDLSGATVPLRIAVRLNGTLNQPEDVDRNCTILLAVPLAELEKNGLRFAPGHAWLILAGRANYTRYQPHLEYSSHPQTCTDFHNSRYYARIVWQ